MHFATSFALCLLWGTIAHAGGHPDSQACSWQPDPITDIKNTPNRWKMFCTAELPGRDFTLISTSYKCSQSKVIVAEYFPKTQFKNQKSDQVQIAHACQSNDFGWLPSSYCWGKSGHNGKQQQGIVACTCTDISSPGCKCYGVNAGQSCVFDVPSRITQIIMYYEVGVF